MSDKKMQDFLFQRIKETLPPGGSLADTIAEVLCVSQDSAYRRIRGETPLVLEEARILCQQFNISLDQLLALRGESVVFQNMMLETNGVDFKAYLQGILQQIKQLNSFEQKSIIYLTNDIPIFHQFGSPAIFAFRYFFWMRTIFQHPGFIKRPFSFDCLSSDIEELGQEISAIYAKIPSIEIWNTECVNSTLTQLYHYHETGVLSKAQLREIYAGLRTTLEHLQLQADYGRKFLPGENAASKKENFKLFYNRVGLGDNTILTQQDGSKTLYLNYDALNYMITTDEAFCEKVYQKMQTIMRRSTLISSASEKQRNIFFNILYGKLPRYELKKEKMAS